MRWMRLTMRQRHEFDDMHPPSLCAVKQKTSDDTSGVLRFDDMAGTYMYVLTCLIWMPLSLCIYVLRCRVATNHTPLGASSDHAGSTMLGCLYFDTACRRRRRAPSLNRRLAALRRDCAAYVQYGCESNLYGRSGR